MSNRRIVIWMAGLSDRTRSHLMRRPDMAQTPSAANAARHWTSSPLDPFRSSRPHPLAAKDARSGEGVNQCFHPYVTRPAVDSGPQAWTCSASATVLATRATALYVDSSGLS